MSEWLMVKLGEVCRISIGKTPARKEPRYWGDGLPWLSIKDMNQGPLLNTTSETITNTALSELNISPYPAGTVLFSFKLSIGKVGITTKPMFTNEAIAAIEPHNINSLDKPYLAEALRFIGQSLEGNAAVMGITLNKKSLAEINIPLPPLEEQKRIAKMLGQVILTINKVQHNIENTLSFKKTSQDSIINDNITSFTELSQIASIQSGITKGRKTKEDTPLKSVPYMAVSNVKAGHLDFSTVKEIDASEAEIDRYLLKTGDILLTEGGDPDKLGRGSIWRNEIQEAIHQNHIFRVRINPTSNFTSEALMATLESKESKYYFLRSAKQTTGISSINKTQLSATPIPVLDQAQVNEITRIWHDSEQIIALYRQKLALLQELQRSLSVRAFAGLL